MFRKYRIQGYSMFRKDRMGRRGGGVLLYINDTIPAYEVQLQEEAYCNEAIWCKLVTGHTTVTIWVVYRCPNHRRTGRGAGGGSCPPPQFGQFVDMNSGRESTLFGQNTIHVWITRIEGLLLQLTEKKTNLGSVTGVNGKMIQPPT